MRFLVLAFYYDILDPVISAQAAFGDAVVEVFEEDMAQGAVFEFNRRHGHDGFLCVGKSGGFLYEGDAGIVFDAECVHDGKGGCGDEEDDSQAAELQRM